MEKAEMKIAPSTPTLSIAATISSPLTCGGQFGTLCQGRFGVFASYTWTWESIIVIGKLLYALRVWQSQQARVQRAEVQGARRRLRHSNADPHRHRRLDRRR